MISRVVVSPRLISGFRKAARGAYPCEVIQTLWGRLQGTTVTITDIRPLEHKSTDVGVEYWAADAVTPNGTGEVFLGTIHSHPDCEDASPSEIDWEYAFAQGELIFGVMSICDTGPASFPKGKFKTTVSWWEPRPSISMIHPRVRGNKLSKEKQCPTKTQETTCPSEPVSQVI